MKARILLSIAMSAAMLLSSCVSKKSYQSLIEERDNLRSDYTALQKDYHNAQVALTQSNTNGQSLQQRLDDALKANADLRNAYASLQRTLDQSLANGNQNSINI